MAVTSPGPQRSCWSGRFFAQMWLFYCFYIFPSGIVLSSRTKNFFCSGSSLRSSSSSISRLVDVRPETQRSLSYQDFLPYLLLFEGNSNSANIHVRWRVTENSLALNEELKFEIEISDLLVPCVNMKRGPVKICNSTWRVYIEYIRGLWVSIAELSLKNVFSWKSNSKWIFKKTCFMCGLCETFSLRGL